MEASIQKLAAISFFVMGLSHICQPRAWAEFFILLRDKGAPGNFINALLTLPMGALIVSFHNVWSGIPLILTLLGWAYVAKSLLFFVYPPAGLRSLSLVSLEKSHRFIVPGVMLLVVSGLLTYSLVTT